MKILIMAAAGNQGSVLVPRFAEAGFDVRAVRASPGRDQEVLALGAKEVMVGNAADRGFLAEAVSGVDVVYHVGPTAHPLEREMGFAMVDAVREANVGHLIYSSVLHPEASLMVQHKLKAQVEEHLLQANINFTIFQPADYLVPAQFEMAFKMGLWEAMYNLDRPQAMIALTDVADAAVKVARERERHFGATYQLCAPGMPSMNDVARAIEKVTGLSMPTKQVPPDEFFNRYYGKGQGDKFPYELTLIRSVGMWYEQFIFAGNSNVLRWLLEREPTTLEQFIQTVWDEYQAKNKAVATAEA